MIFKKLSHITNFPDTPAGRVCRKFQDYTGTGNVYAYSPNNKQHAVRRIYNGLTNELSNLRWDNNGNLAQQTVYSLNNNVPTFLNMRMLFWDEDDRLNLVAGDGYLSYYAYGHDGNRAIKMTGNAAIDQTGTLLNSTNLENITIYPSEYLTVTQAEYTKYYYAGGNRIASKIGTGGFGKMQRLCTLDQSLTYNANTLLNFVLYQIANVTNQPNDEYPVDVCAGYNVSNELLHSPLPDFYISQTNLNFTQNNLLQQFRQNLTNSVEPVYYFHSDHLGSASWITNSSGLPVQHLLYLPFGEHFVNEQSSGYFERFTFTGKERDAETGYYYHGARFNSSDLGWLSVDQMSDKYPSISPYAYCAWNPIKLVDPEGRDTVFSFATRLSDNEQNRSNMNILNWMRYQGDIRGIVTLGFHGTPKRIYMAMFDGEIEQRYNAIDLATIVSKMNLPDYKKNKESNNPTIFLFYSCRTGNGKGSFAEQFSYELQCITIAPQGLLMVNPNNHTMKNVLSKTDDTEQPWNVFYRGRKVTSFSGIQPKEWIEEQGGIKATTEKIIEMDRKSHPWE